MNRQNFSGLLITLLFLASCQDNSNSTSQSPTGTPSPVGETTNSNIASPIAQANDKLAPGEYCYQAKTETLSANAKLNISADSKVNGTVEATIQNPAQGYFSSYTQDLTGQLNGNKAKLKVVTKIENDIQNKEETWTITESSLKTDRESFTKADCSTLTQEISTPENSNAPKPMRVQFAPGASSKVLKDAVVRGDRAVYLVGAKQGQQMNLKITSLENNAVFDVIAPDGKTIKQEATTWNSKLSTNGDYQIIVGGTRGNATYELTVEIK